MTRHRLITLLLTAALASATLLAAPRHNNILSLKNSITDDDIVFP
jgi:hypothetical protein